MQAVHDLQKQPDPVHAESRAVPPHMVHDDPLLACMVALTKIHGHPCSAQALSGGLPLVNDRLTLSLLPRAAARAHCSARLLRRQLKNLPDALLPAILILKGDRACLLLEVRAGTYVVQYPEVESPVEVAADVLDADYMGLAYFVKPLFRFEPRARDTPQARSKHWFWAVVFENWRLYRDALLA